MDTLYKVISFIAIIGGVILIAKRKGDVDMLDMYVALVIAKRRTCNPENTSVKLVPTAWREKVLADLNAIGYDADGNIVE